MAIEFKLKDSQGLLDLERLKKLLTSYLPQFEATLKPDLRFPDESELLLMSQGLDDPCDFKLIVYPNGRTLFEGHPDVLEGVAGSEYVIGGQVFPSYAESRTFFIELMEKYPKPVAPDSSGG